MEHRTAKRQMTILHLRKSETDFQYNKEQNYHNVYVQQDYIKVGTGNFLVLNSATLIFLLLLHINFKSTI